MSGWLIVSGDSGWWVVGWIIVIEYVIDRLGLVGCGWLVGSLGPTGSGVTPTGVTSPSTGMGVSPAGDTFIHYSVL